MDFGPFHFASDFNFERFLMWIPLLPLLGAIILGTVGRRASRGLVHALSVGTVTASFFFAVVCFVRLATLEHGEGAEEPAGFTVTLYEWFKLSLGDAQIPVRVAFTMDRLSGVMTLVVTGIGALIHLYATGYMSEEKSYARFFCYLNLFTASMLVLVLASSMPLMFDVLHERPTVKKVDEKNWIVPVENHGVKLLSIGFFADLGQAIAWRGPMASKALDQLFKDADWGELDVMLVDLPPGTGDIHLSLVQAIPLTGAIIVSTPQPVAVADARKGVGFFQLPSVNVPVLGIVENMAWFTPAELPNNKYYIFGQGGARLLSEELKVPFLAEVPLVQSIREAADVGRPAVLQGDTPAADAFRPLVESVVRTLMTTPSPIGSPMKPVASAHP